jgi:hypothetical protein
MMMHETGFAKASGVRNGNVHKHEVDVRIDSRRQSSGHTLLAYIGYHYV